MMRISGNLSAKLGLLLIAGTALSACNTSDTGGALGIGGNKEAKAQEQRVLASELTGYCPNVTLREGTAYFTSYAKGADLEDGSKNPALAMYQASITDVTRSCSRANGMLTINVAVAGRVVPGPKASGASVTMPIRVAMVTDGTNVLYSQLQQFQVTVNPTDAATQFVFNDPNGSVPEAQAKAIQIFVGFDEGAPKAPKTKKKVAG